MGWQTGQDGLVVILGLGPILSLAEHPQTVMQFRLLGIFSEQSQQLHAGLSWGGLLQNRLKGRKGV
jgi:hypothetical protein